MTVKRDEYPPLPKAATRDMQDVFKELDKLLQSVGRPVQNRTMGPDGIGIERRRATAAMHAAVMKEREDIAKMMDAEAKASLTGAPR